MSFRTHARRARNTELPFSVRLCAFRSCIGIYCWTGNTRKSFDEIFSRYNDEFDLDADTLDAQDLVVALDALETERNEFLERLQMFDKKRIRAKSLGQRTPSRSELAWLTY